MSKVELGNLDPTEYSIGVWDMTFYVVDNNGNPLKDENGEVRVFHAPDIDYSYMTDGLDVNELREG